MSHLDACDLGIPCAFTRTSVLNRYGGSLPPASGAVDRAVGDVESRTAAGALCGKGPPYAPPSQVTSRLPRGRLAFEGFDGLLGPDLLPRTGAALDRRALPRCRRRAVLRYAVRVHPPHL